MSDEPPPPSRQSQRFSNNPHNRALQRLLAEGNLSSRLLNSIDPELLFSDDDVTSDEDGLETPTQVRLSPAEIAIREKIEDCMDRGDETVDLQNMGLEELSHETVEYLRKTVCMPSKGFLRRGLGLKLFLSSNRLSQLPGNLFDFTKITTLNLSANALTTLPPAICKLTKLKRLDLSQNKLTHLPAEILDLLKTGAKLEHFIISGNPFILPESPADGKHKVTLIPGPSTGHRFIGYTDTRTIPHYMTRWLGRSPVQFSNSVGHVLSEFRLLSKGETTTATTTTTVLPVEVSSDEFGLATTYDPRPRASARHRRQEMKPSGVRSLVEIALWSCIRNRPLAELETLMEGEQLRKLLRRAVSQKSMGGLTCSTCRKRLIVPAMEWIEWRELRFCLTSPLLRRDPPIYYEHTTIEALITIILTTPYTKVTSDMAVPFLHRACSWTCGPKDLEKDVDWLQLGGDVDLDEI